jgi:hypothetical protein
MDKDGDPDVLFTDRRGQRSGCFWLEHPGTNGLQQPWREHVIGGVGQEVMFLALADLDQDSREDVLVAARPSQILYFRRGNKAATEWSTHVISLPSNAGSSKAVNVGDLDLDGKLDLVFTTEGAMSGKRGVMWLSYRASPTESDWMAHDISGADGVKHDLVQLIDLDADGDLDVLTCEETKGLGVFWYENPVR